MELKREQKLARLFNRNYAFLDFTTFEKDATTYKLIFDLDNNEIPLEEFENTEFEEALYNEMFAVFVDPFMEYIFNIHGVLHAHFLASDKHKDIVISVFVGIGKDDFYYAYFDTRKDFQLEVDRIKNEIDERLD